MSMRHCAIRIMKGMHIDLIAACIDYLGGIHSIGIHAYTYTEEGLKACHRALYICLCHCVCPIHTEGGLKTCHRALYTPMPLYPPYTYRGRIENMPPSSYIYIGLIHTEEESQMCHRAHKQRASIKAKHKKMIKIWGVAINSSGSTSIASLAGCSALGCSGEAAREGTSL